MILQRNFYILTYEGEDILPDSVDKKVLIEQGKEIAMYLDANVCFDILSYFNGIELKPDKLINIETIILFCQHNKVTVVPKFGSVELAFNRKSRQIDISKFQDMVNKITYTFDTPYSKGIKLNERAYPYYVEVGQKDIDTFNTFLPLLLLSYTTLLKLYIICKENNPNKGNIRSNLKRFCDWCDKELNISMASEIQLAVKIFGGVSDFRKMIALDKNAGADEILRIIWGTAFDFFHLRIIHFAGISSEINLHSYFITQDENIFSLFKTCKLEKAITTKNYIALSMLSSDLDIQYKRDKTFAIIEDILLDFFYKRLKKVQLFEHYDIKTFNELTDKLEQSIRKFANP